MPNYASALGEAVGKLIEARMADLLTPVAESYGYYYDRGGTRPGVRRGKTLALANASGIRYRIDGVIEDAERQPIVLLESKYLRYQKHNRDKASWTCVAHYNLHKNFPTVRKSIALLTGRWTAQSKSLMTSFGIELHEVPFDHIADTSGPRKWSSAGRKGTPPSRSRHSGASGRYLSKRGKGWAPLCWSL